MEQHPLSREDEWFFSQHNVKVHAPIFRGADKRKKHTPNTLRSQKMVIHGSNMCREGVLSSIRQQLRTACGTRCAVAGRPSWDREYRAYGEISLDRASLKQPGESFVSVHSAHITANRSKPNPHYMAAAELARACRRGHYPPWHHRVEHRMIRCSRGKRLTKTDIQNYLDICDAVVGPITVLLNPDRYQGNWWFTGVDDCLVEGKTSGDLRWFGVDNTILAHPALTSLYAGLVRQCAYIARTNCADQVREDVEGMNLEDCLNESDEVQAMRILKKMQKWIAVPTLKGGRSANIPVGTGTLHKIIDMHKSIYEHGFEATFRGRSFIERWNLSGATGKLVNGIHSYMGEKGTNMNGKYIIRMSRKKAA